MPATTRNQKMREAAATSPSLPQPSLPHDRIMPARDPKTTTTPPPPPPHASSSTTRPSTTRPPTFIINLALPPEQRYLAVCAAFAEEMAGLGRLFDEVVGGMLDRVPLPWLHATGRMLLRRVRDGEEDGELRGISTATGVPMYLLICFNVLLDLFMGCSSGGAAVRDGDGDGVKNVHFRTLDWGMPSLRKVVVQLDFQTESGGPIVASSVTYAGYVGVLTGVRKGLSLSLNFRPTRNDKGQFVADARYWWHLVMVLLGWRRSISSELRRFLLPAKKRKKKKKGVEWTYWPYEDVVKKVSWRDGGGSPLATTACYLCFSDGKSTTVMEKDHYTAVVRSSDDFIVITNHDLGAETDDEEDMRRPDTAGEKTSRRGGDAMRAIVHESRDRRRCAEDHYRRMRAAQGKRKNVVEEERAEWKRLLDVSDIVSLVQRFPTTNEETHYACVMDAKVGEVVWCRRWEEDEVVLEK